MDEQLRQQIIERIGPDVINRMVTQLMQDMDEDVEAEDLRPIVELLTRVMQEPALYPQAVEQLVAAEIVQPGVMPEEFEPTLVAFLLIVLTEVAKILQQRNTGGIPAQFAHGGLAKMARELQTHGRHGDTILAHITPQEAAALKRMGGSGTINPDTGLPEFFLKKISKAVGNVFEGAVNVVKGVVKELGPVAPIIAAVVAPYAIPAIAGSLGVSTIAAGALYGAGTSAIMGQDPLKGALMGGLSGGLGQTIGSAASDYFNLGLAPATQTLLGNTLVGGFGGAATGRGFAGGAINAAIGTQLGSTVGKLAGQGAGTPIGAGLTQAGKTIGELATAGVPLQKAVVGGALSGLVAGTLAGRQTPLDKAAGVETDIDAQMARAQKLIEDPTVPETAKQAYRDYAAQLEKAKQTMAGYRQTLSVPQDMVLPSQAGEYERVANLMTKPGEGFAYKNVRGIYEQLGIPDVSPTAQIGATDVGFNKPTAIAAAAALAPLALSSIASAQTPQQIQQAVQSAATSNPEYFNNLRLQSWDWDDISRRAQQAGMPLGSYVASNWNTLTQQSAYTSPGGTTSTAPTFRGSQTQQEPVKAARGGALSQVAYLAGGSGSGRADTIDARLSDGEYVIDAETVAMLGDGSTKAGAARLDQMRNQIRKHKGRALAKGKFSPNAKSPLAYLKGAM